MVFDPTTSFGERVARRLRDERIIWLTTIGASGQPQPSPVWFLWDGESFLIYSQPDTPKLRGIARNPKVALNFDGDGQGGDIIVFDGEARIVEDAPLATDVPEYVEKYRAASARIGMEPDSFARQYSTAIRVTPRKVRGH